MGNRIIKKLNIFIDEFLYLIFPPQNRCVACGIEYIGLCPLCFSKLVRVKSSEKIISYGYYSGVLKDIILEFKYKKNFFAGEIISDFIIELIKENKINGDYILYVPGNRESIKKRGFDQCNFIAKKISIKLDIPLLKDIKKKNNIKEQKRLSKEERYINIKDAFYIKEKNNIEGKEIILIDDVITTGATLLEVEKILIEGKASKINILTVAKSYI
jgi:competence protein ComFC